jgi:glutathione S-transferase
MQTVQIRLAGFNGGTVPALRSVGRRALGTVAISRLLEEIRPQPPLFPRIRPAGARSRRRRHGANAFCSRFGHAQSRRGWSSPSGSVFGCQVGGPAASR